MLCKNLLKKWGFFICAKATSQSGACAQLATARELKEKSEANFLMCAKATSQSGARAQLATAREPKRKEQSDFRVVCAKATSQSALAHSWRLLLNDSEVFIKNEEKE